MTPRSPSVVGRSIGRPVGRCLEYAAYALAWLPWVLGWLVALAVVWTLVVVEWAARVVVRRGSVGR